MTPHRPSTHDTDDRSDMDERAIRRAAAAGDVPALIAATDGVRIDPGLQLVGYVAVGLWRAADPDRRALLEPCWPGCATSSAAARAPATGCWPLNWPRC